MGAPRGSASVGGWPVRCGKSVGKGWGCLQGGGLVCVAGIRPIVEGFCWSSFAERGTPDPLDNWNSEHPSSAMAGCSNATCDE